MTCFIAQNELSALVDDALEAARAAELQAHLAGCTNCSRELHEIRKVRSMLRAMPVHRAPPDFLAKVKAKAQKKSAWERVTAAIAPLLELPRPAQAGLALAASLVIAVTVFWNNPNKNLDDLGASPVGLREVANVSKPQETLDLEKLSTNESAEGAKAEATLALTDRLAEENDQDELRRQEEQSRKGGTLANDPNAGGGLALGAAPPPSDAGAFADKSRSSGKSAVNANAVVSEPAPVFKSTAQPAPAPAATSSYAVGGAGATSGSSSNREFGGSGRSASQGYVAPTQPGLYASTPASAGTPAATPAPRAKADVAKPVIVPAKEAPAAATSTRDEREPSYDSASGWGDSPTGANDDVSSGGDIAVVADAQQPDPFAETKSSKAKDLAGAKKLEARRDRDAKSGEKAPAEAPAPMSAAVETESVATAAPVAAAGPVTQLSAKYLSANATAPADVIAAAKAAGGRVVSPTGSAPGLGKLGASTVVIVEIPAASVASFEEALRAGGTLEHGALPSGTVRYRIEVVRQ